MRKHIFLIICVVVSVLTFLVGCQKSDISGNISTSSKNEILENTISDNYAEGSNVTDNSQFYTVSEKISLPKIKNYKNNIKFDDAQKEQNLIKKIPSVFSDSITDATVYYDDFSEIMTTLKETDQNGNIQKEVYILFQETSEPTMSLYQADDIASFVTAYIDGYYFKAALEQSEITIFARGTNQAEFMEYVKQMTV